MQKILGLCKVGTILNLPHPSHLVIQAKSRLLWLFEEV